MYLGNRIFAIGDTRVIRVNYTDFLLPGYTILGVVANFAPQAVTPTSSFGSIVLDPVDLTAYITLVCGSVNESFTVNVIATDTYGQVINDTLNVQITDPGAF